jgi:hypothetical protein
VARPLQRYGAPIVMAGPRELQTLAHERAGGRILFAVDATDEAEGGGGGGGGPRSGWGSWRGGGGGGGGVGAAAEQEQEQVFIDLDTTLQFAEDMLLHDVAREIERGEAKRLEQRGLEKSCRSDDSAASASWFYEKRSASCEKRALSPASPDRSASQDRGGRQQDVSSAGASRYASGNSAALPLSLSYASGNGAAGGRGAARSNSGQQSAQWSQWAGAGSSYEERVALREDALSTTEGLAKCVAMEVAALCPELARSACLPVLGVLHAQLVGCADYCLQGQGRGAEHGTAAGSDADADAPRAGGDGSGGDAGGGDGEAAATGAAAAGASSPAPPMQTRVCAAHFLAAVAAALEVRRFDTGDVIYGCGAADVQADPLLLSAFGGGAYPTPPLVWLLEGACEHASTAAEVERHCEREGLELPYALRGRRVLRAGRGAGLASGSGSGSTAGSRGGGGGGGAGKRAWAAAAAVIERAEIAPQRSPRPPAAAVPATPRGGGRSPPPRLPRLPGGGVSAGGEDGPEERDSAAGSGGTGGGGGPQHCLGPLQTHNAFFGAECHLGRIKAVRCRSSWSGGGGSRRTVCALLRRGAFDRLWAADPAVARLLLVCLGGDRALKTGGVPGRHWSAN